MFVSIIIPTYNRCQALARTLASLAHMDSRLEGCEVLIVDNGSNDHTRQAVGHFSTRCFNREIKYYFEPVPGLLSGRHRGVLEASGKICAFLDDDVRVGPNWLAALVETFRDPTVVVVGGPARPLFESPPPEWLPEFYGENEHVRFCGWLSLLDGGDRVKEIDPCCVWGLNYAIRRDTLIGVGGFNPDTVPKPLQRYQGDGETGLSLKVRTAGLKAIYHPDAHVEHEVPSDRMTVNYFEQRALYQGVCDSYTSIRRNREVETRRNSWKSPLRKVKHFFARRIGFQKSGVTEIRSRTNEAYARGYAFHREEVRRDPNLLAWVLKEDYFDYRLPDGWEGRLER